jgi:hypothetical protein
VGLVGQWAELQETLSTGWGEARIRVELEPSEPAERAAALLGTLQPLLAGSVLTFRVARDGTGPTAEMARRSLGHLDAERIHGRLELVSATTQAVQPRERVVALAESWDGELGRLPADWSDLLGEVELDSSDYLERAALLLAPVNPRRDGDRLALQFRSARSFGYGASPGMVRRCLDRCDDEGMRGSVQILRALSDTRPAQTQGPVWYVGGHTV